MRDDSAELLFQPFLQEAFVSNSGVGRGDAISNIQPIAAENTLGDNWPFSVQSLHRLGRQGDMRDDSAEILFQSFLQEALVSSSGMDGDVHFFLLSIQHFLCRPRRRPPSKVP